MDLEEIQLVQSFQVRKFCLNFQHTLTTLIGPIEGLV